jgi:predicted nucleic-acid-binding Zn-ribbon protein
MLKEQEFWELLEASKASTEDEILLTKEQLENIEDITEEQWANVFEKNPGLKIMTSNQLERLISQEPERQYPPLSTISYAPGNLGPFEDAHPSAVFWPAFNCPNCGEQIPYSIDKDRQFCFKCGSTSVRLPVSQITVEDSIVRRNKLHSLESILEHQQAIQTTLSQYSEEEIKSILSKEEEKEEARLQRKQARREARFIKK